MLKLRVTKAMKNVPDYFWKMPEIMPQRLEPLSEGCQFVALGKVWRRRARSKIRTMERRLKA